MVSGWALDTSGRWWRMLIVTSEWIFHGVPIWACPSWGQKDHFHFSCPCVFKYQFSSPALLHKFIKSVAVVSTPAPQLPRSPVEPEIQSMNVHPRVRNPATRPALASFLSSPGGVSDLNSSSFRMYSKHWVYFALSKLLSDTVNTSLCIDLLHKHLFFFKRSSVLRPRSCSSQISTQRLCSPSPGASSWDSWTTLVSYCVLP